MLVFVIKVVTDNGYPDWLRNYKKSVAKNIPLSFVSFVLCSNEIAMKRSKRVLEFTLKLFTRRTFKETK